MRHCRLWFTPTVGSKALDWRRTRMPIIGWLATLHHLCVFVDTFIAVYDLWKHQLVTEVEIYKYRKTHVVKMWEYRLVCTLCSVWSPSSVDGWGSTARSAARTSSWRATFSQMKLRKRSPVPRKICHWLIDHHHHHHQYKFVWRPLL